MTLTKEEMQKKTWFKILKPDGRSNHGGNHLYSLPVDGKPGDWHEHTGELGMCAHGFHLTHDAKKWAFNDCKFCIAEIDWSKDYLYDDDDKICVNRTRLLREASADELMAQGIYIVGTHTIVCNGNDKLNILLWGSSQATVKTLDSSQATVKTLGSSQATVKTLGSSQATVETLDSSQATVETWDSSQATVKTLGSSQATVKTLDSSQATVKTLGSSQATVKTLDSSQATVKTWDSSQATVKTLGSSQATVETWGSSQATVETWDSSQATVETLDSSQATVETWGSSICRNLTERKIYIKKSAYEIIEM